MMFSIYVEFINSNVITRFIVEVLDSLIWFGLMFLLLSILLVILHLFIVTPIILRRILIILIILLFIYGYYNSHNPRITERTLYLNNLDEEIDIIHLSDIHIGSVRREGLLKKISKKINSINPDIVLISGDLVDGSNEIKPNTFEELGKIKAPVIFNPGNHDYYFGFECVIKACENAGITVLDNQQMKFKGLNIYGISYSFISEKMEFEDLDFKINKNENNLLIFHIPSNWDEFIELGFNIMLSGHTHGGQFYPAKVWVKLVYPKLRGLFEKEGNYLNISDGVGTMGPPIRIGTKAEIGLLKLRKRD
ncbi:MAG: metallophosphoesterase [Methanobrevibacter sp.]|nr:metallophosphoesterase [Methanobrevibacter sp.]